jgi:hypothetical protein
MRRSLSVSVTSGEDVGGGELFQPFGLHTSVSFETAVPGRGVRECRREARNNVSFITRGLPYILR